jgi:hypothetical protein
MPRTILIPLLAAWNHVKKKHPKVAATVQSYEKMIKYFIKAHATDEDRHDHLAQLRSARKPRIMSVQLFYYRLRELNDQAAWLPGDAALLTDEDLKQAFYDGMPTAWKEKFLNSGKTVHHETEVDVLRHFRQQQSIAEQLAAATVKAQKKSGRHKHGARNETERVQPHRNESKGSGGGAKYGPPQAKQQNKANRRCNDDEPWNSDHTCGECLSNHYNKKRNANAKTSNGGKKGSPKKGSFTDEKVDSHAMEETVIAPV